MDAIGVFLGQSKGKSTSSAIAVSKLMPTATWLNGILLKKWSAYTVYKCIAATCINGLANPVGVAVGHTSAIFDSNVASMRHKLENEHRKSQALAITCVSVKVKLA